MNRIDLIITGQDPRWELVFGHNVGGVWRAKIKVRKAHAFSTGQGPTLKAAVRAAYESVNLGLEVVS